MNTKLKDTYEATPEELEAIDRGLRDAAQGRFATREQVEAVFAKYRKAEPA
jgi:predicted transcriptional regulator